MRRRIEENVYPMVKSSLPFEIAALIFLFSAKPLQADWQWPNDLAQATLTPGGYVAKFSFENTGAGDITVTALTFSCPCTIYRFTATTAKPGKSGLLTILIQNSNAASPGHDIEVIAFGSSLTKARELTIRTATEATK